MHYRYLVTFNKGNAENSEEARGHVQSYLIDNGFVHSDGRWSSGIADWFVIGGRWSGELSFNTKWGKEFEDKVKEFLKLNYPTLDSGVVGVWYGDKEREKAKCEAIKEIEKMWAEALPEGYPKVPYIRDTYKDDGYEDDAVILTQELHDNLLKEYEGKVESEYHADLDYEEVSPDFVGKKWIVVVDYHN